MNPPEIRDFGLFNLCAFRLFGLLMLAGQALAAEGQLLERFTNAGLTPAISATAQSEKIPITGFEAAWSEEKKLAPGDSATAIVTLTKSGGEQTKWLVFLQVVPPKPSEIKSSGHPPLTIYSALGTKLDYASSPATMTARTLGPFSQKKSQRRDDKEARFEINESFLALGLDRGAELMLLLAQRKVKGGFSFQNNPFPEGQIQENRKADRLNLTADEERVLGGTAPALMSYFNIVQHAPGLSDILFKIIDLPVWSIVWNRGVQARFAMKPKEVTALSLPDWKLPAEFKVHTLPMTLEMNNKPTLEMTLIVVPPRPPFLACGGVVGLLAETPGSKGSYLTMRVVSARGAISKK